MNTAFLRFNDSALKSGVLQLNPSLANELKQVTESFVTLAKSAASEGSHDGDDSELALDPALEFHNATASARALKETRPTETNHPPVPQHTDVGWGYTASLIETTPPRETASTQRNDLPTHSNFFPPMQDSPYQIAKRSSFMRNTSRITVGQLFDQPRDQQDASSSQEQQLPFGLMDVMMSSENLYNPNPHIYSVNIPTPAITPPITRLPTPPLPSLLAKSLAPAWTYSHDETTFARRLTRASLEVGFHLLSMANQRPAALNHVFKLSLPYMSLEGLRERFKLLLARGTDEPLDYWATPFIHLGGAGTHYPQKDAQGNIIPQPNSWNIRSIGPMKMIRAESTTDPSQTLDMQMDLTGYEGEWFDAHDVQGYLEAEKGCYINPKESFAEVMIDVDDQAYIARLGSSLNSKNSNMKLDLSNIRRTSDSQSESPSLSNGSTSTTSSSKSTPTNTMDNIFGQSETFGLDMGVNNYNDFSKLNDIDIAAMFDQPLGLDLAPGFDSNMTSGFNNSFVDFSNLGLDSMGGDREFPVVKQKQKQVALVDVSKLIHGRFPCFHSALSYD